MFCHNLLVIGTARYGAGQRHAQNTLRGRGLEPIICDQEAAPLEQQERTALKTGFDKVDAEGSGAINFEQMTQFIDDLGWNLTAQAAFDFLDKGQSDTLTFEEFLRWKGFAWQHKVALVRRLSSRNLQSSLDQIDENEDEDVMPDTLHENEAEEDENVKQLQSTIETLQNNLARLHENYEDLCEVMTCQNRELC